MDPHTDLKGATLFFDHCLLARRHMLDVAIATLKMHSVACLQHLVYRSQCRFDIRYLCRQSDWLIAVADSSEGSLAIMLDGGSIGGPESWSIAGSFCLNRTEMVGHMWGHHRVNGS